MLEFEKFFWRILNIFLTNKSVYLINIIDGQLYK